MHMYICTEYKKNSYLYKMTSRNFIKNQSECSKEQVSLITLHMNLSNVHCSPLLVASPSFALTQCSIRQVKAQPGVWCTPFCLALQTSYFSKAE